MGDYDSPKRRQDHSAMTDMEPRRGSGYRWWLTPVVIGLVITAVVLLLGDFRPIVERFYSVF